MKLATRLNGKISRKAAVKALKQKLVDLNRTLGDTVEAIDKGEIDIEDLTWESEFAPTDSSRSR